MSDNTSRSFYDKWHQNERLAFAETLREGSEIHQWILRRNGFASDAELKRYLSDKRRILDAGCGNGRVTALLCECASADAALIGIDLVAADVARKNLAGYRNVEVSPADLLGDLSSLGRFDFIYCQEVLHHTADPQRAFRNVCTLLAAGGEIAIYVYKRKAAAREFVDDYVRERIAKLPYEDAMAVCRQITELGRALSDCGLRVKVPAVEVLGIESGEYDVQRFVYHFFMKCFWNPALSFEENVAINYDWYHPQLASRHTPEEVEGWFRDAGLQVTQRCVDPYGITMRGARR
jgi:SAM-dependent methyltransferase